MAVSALGHKRTFRNAIDMSALTGQRERRRDNEAERRDQHDEVDVHAAHGQRVPSSGQTMCSPCSVSTSLRSGPALDHMVKTSATYGTGRSKPPSGRRLVHQALQRLLHCTVYITVSDTATQRQGCSHTVEKQGSLLNLQGLRGKHDAGELSIR
jgi:hypothetical protein